MKKIILLSILAGCFFTKASSQTTIHGQADPVILYELIDGNFFQVVTSDIWVYANESYGVGLPYSLQLGTPPPIEGIPVPDFRPMSCYDAQIAYGRTAVKCGPFNVFVENNQRIISCGGSDQTTCEIKYTKDGVDHVLHNPQVN